MEVHRRTNNRTDRRVDVQVDSYMPPPKLRLRGYNYLLKAYFDKHVTEQLTW